MNTKSELKTNLNWAEGFRQELSKVSWPSRRDALQLTLIVVIISTLLGVYIGVFDYIFAAILKLILN
jgi:preprotein translocase SecE subunit